WRIARRQLRNDSICSQSGSEDAHASVAEARLWISSPMPRCREAFVVPCGVSISSQDCLTANSWTGTTMQCDCSPVGAEFA
ncbi:hypothetical protein COCCADRAFT_110550, partial [Bipolaris zeicola 26-R-13]